MAELSKEPTTVIERFEDFGYPPSVLTCYTMDFKRPTSSENCRINESILKAGFNSTAYSHPNDYVNKFNEDSEDDNNEEDEEDEEDEE